MSVRTIPEADEDVALIADHLERARPGHGRLFFADYRKALEYSELFPRMYPEVEDGVAGVEIRNAVLSRFRLRIVYAVLSTEAVVVATVHSRRRLGIWHDRVPGLS